MDLIKQMTRSLDHASSVLGFDCRHVQQQSLEWHSMRLGVITASKAKAILSGSSSRTYKTYLYQLAAEISTKSPSRSETFSAKATDHGNDFEPLARDKFIALTGKKVIEWPFTYTDETMRCGFSPDGIIVEENCGVELKCPWATENHWEHIDTGIIPAKDSDAWKKQVQFTMWAAKLDKWYFSTFEPDMTKRGLVFSEIHPDEKMWGDLDKKVPQFIKDLDILLEKGGYQFGDQWK